MTGCSAVHDHITVLRSTSGSSYCDWRGGTESGLETVDKKDRFEEESQVGLNWIILGTIVCFIAINRGDICCTWANSAIGIWGGLE